MSTNKGYPLYKFASLRSPEEKETATDDIEISPITPLANSLIIINEDDALSNDDKLEQFNAALQTYIDSEEFIKTKVQFELVKESLERPEEEDVETLFNNVLVRTLTKSTTNTVYKLVVDQLKVTYKAVYETGVTALKVVIPERLAFTFNGFEAPEEETPESPEVEQEAIANKLKHLVELEGLVIDAKEEHVISFDSPTSIRVRNTAFSNVNLALNTSSISVTDALAQIDQIIAKLEAVRIDGTNEALPRFKDLKIQVEKARAAGIRIINDYIIITTDRYAKVAAISKSGSITIEDAERYVKREMAQLSGRLHRMGTNKQYSLVGDRWVDTTEYASRAAGGRLPRRDVLQYDKDCNLKSPFQIADLRVVEQQPVGYLPGEIAHINNTQPGEKNLKVTRRLKKVENYDSLISDEEVFRETDTQSTEKFGIEKAATNVQNESQAINVNTSLAANFGTYSLNVDAGYSNASSSTSANSTSQSHAKEVVESIVDRVSNRVRTERSQKTIEEFEETVTHEIDNTGQGAKSYVYRWLNKLVRATLKNYGKRLIYQFDVAHPAHYYLSRSIKELPAVNLPANPRELSADGNSVVAIDQITRDNYLAWGAIYKTELDAPPPAKVIISDTFAGSTTMSAGKLIPIKKGYKCIKARFTNYTHGPTGSGGSYSIYTIGTSFYAEWTGGGFMWSPATFWLNGETEQLPVSVLAGSGGFSANLEVHCDLTPEAYHEWKVKAYNAIVAGYENLKAEADTELIGFNPNVPGLNPAKKKQLIMDEIKRETIRKMFKCNPFWINDRYVVGNEYSPDCCKDGRNAEKVRFLERVFDWKNMTYELHPYFYADKNSWPQLLDLSDDDPHFEAFLRSSFATVQVPVHRDNLQETAAVNFIRNNSIANYEVVPGDMQDILAELDNNEPTMFTYDLDGNELAEPQDTVDLGVFNLPTSLVILECGTSDGVKPIGFPQSELEPTDDVIIPKQYSPAIIADSCPA